MTPIADMVEQMLSAGIPPDAIVLAVRTAELHAGGDPVAERRRAYDRERKRAERDASTGNSADVHIEEDSKKEEIKKVRKKDSMRGSRLSADWLPDATMAKAEGLTEADISRESARFRDYWAAKPGQGGVKLDWNATWRNWCRNAADRLGRKPMSAVTNTEPIWKPPPGQPSLEEIRAKYGVSHAEADGQEIRGNARLGQNGADHSEELRIPSGSPLRHQVRGPERRAPDD